MEGEAQFKKSIKKGRPVKETKSNNIVKFPEVWMEQLKRNDSGAIKNTIDNYCIILENDEDFKGKLRYNEFTEQICFDDKQLTNYNTCWLRSEVEKKYSIHSEKKLDDAMEIVSRNHKYHPIKEYLEGLKWDGIKRADTTFADYFGAEESEYNAMCIRLIILGAIERIYEPGVKFDPMVIMLGGQGLGKSTFFSYICGDKQYYQGKFDDIDQAYYLTRNKWIIEMSELSAMKKSEQTAMKGFLTRTDDTYNLKWQKQQSNIQRQFVFVGTTNEPVFLNDDTGERRFPVVELSMVKKKFKKKIFPDEGISVEERNKQYEEIKYEISQITAEIYHEWKNGARMYDVPNKFKEDMLKIQSRHKSDDEDIGIIEGYLENCPIGWEICSKMVWCEAFKHPFKDKMLNVIKNKITSVLNAKDDWIEYDGAKDSRKDFKDIPLRVDGRDEILYVNYGKQKCWRKIDLNKEKEKKNGDDFLNQDYIDSYMQFDMSSLPF